MDIRAFQVRLSAARGLTRRSGARRSRCCRPEGEARRQRSSLVSRLGTSALRERGGTRGMARGLRRYQCGCGRTFSPERRRRCRACTTSGTLADRRGVAGEGGDGEGLRRRLRRGGEARRSAGVTGFWRFARSDSEVLKAIVASADETYVLESRNRARAGTQAHARRGGKANQRGLFGEQVPVPWRQTGAERRSARCCPDIRCGERSAAFDPGPRRTPCWISATVARATPLAPPRSGRATKRSTAAKWRERVRGDLHVQTVTSSISRLKDFLRPRRGFARLFDNYLSWFHLVGLAPAPTRACLAAA